MLIKKLSKLGLATVIAGSLVTPALSAENLKIQAMRLGSSWYVFGATLSKLLEDTLPAGSSVEVVPKGGGVGNVISVNAGKADLGLANVATAVWGYNGDPVVYKGTKHENIRAIVGGLNSVWFVGMVRNDFMEKTGQKTLKEILTSGKPVRISMKPKGSTVPVVADMLLEAMGTSRDKVKADGGDVVQVAAKQLPSLVRDDRTDVYFESAVKGHPAVTEADLTGKVTFLDLPAEAIEKLSAQGLAAKPLPPFFNGQNGKPTQSVDFGTQLIVHKDMSDDLAYLITKTVCENKDNMAAAHKAWANFKPEDAWKPENTGIPLHPGAAKYYKERGWMK